MTAAPLKPSPRATAAPPPENGWGDRRKAEDLWSSHGQVAYSMACALLGDESAAMQAVALGMVDFVRSDAGTAADDTTPALARHVYRRSTQLAATASVIAGLPPAMVRLAQLARLQRAALALCVFGGLRYGDAAELLGITPLAAAQLLSSGLDELRRLSEPVIVF